MRDLSDYQKRILKEMGIPLYKMQGQPTNKSATNATAHSDKMIETIHQDSDQLGEIAMRIKNCDACELHQGRTNTVPGVGSPQADWMFVGEAPGKNEDLQGEPFVGRAGKLLDAMISALGMQRQNIFIANVIKCRPPDNRDPHPEEVAQCESYLHQQLDIIKPKVIISLGRVSAQALLKTQATLGSLRGTFHQYGKNETPLVVTYHPAYLLRSPQQKAKAWEDLLMARTLFD